MTARGDLIQSWEANSFVTQVGEDFIISSDDNRLLHTVSIRSIFDNSLYRQYKLTNAVDSIYLEDGIKKTVKVSKYIGLVYYDKLTILSDSTKKYMVIVPENNVGIIIYKK
tara:strand:- start:6960 stop:7292 length:333 start_codon:yes stop_codon:yes gene_type:complete